MKRIVLMGPPGVGKGTQGSLLAADLSIPHITTGGLLRDEVERGTALGLEIADVLRSGRYVDDALTTALLRDRLDLEDAAQGFVLDGYPRTTAQVGALDDLLDERGSAIDTVVLLHAEESTLVTRLAGRPVGREDDRPEVVRDRLARYESVTEPLTSAYEARGLLRRINGSYPVDLVAAAVTAAVRAVWHPVKTHGLTLR